MANNTKELYYTLSSKDTVPASTSTAATITATSGDRWFTISAAQTDFGVGSWIWDTANDELYKVVYMDGTTRGYIYGTFADTLSGGAFDYIKRQDSKVVRMSIKANADTTVNGQTLLAGDSLNFDCNQTTTPYSSRNCDAKIVDGATGAAEIVVIKR